MAKTINHPYGKTPEGFEKLVKVLKNQLIIQNNNELATSIAEQVIIEVFDKDSILMEQGDDGDDIYFILSGSFHIIVKDHIVGTRASGQHIGEMVMLEPGKKRSAKIVAKEKSIVAKLSERKLSTIAKEYYVIWEFFAKTLAERLREREKLLPPRNQIPHLFIGSSVEGLAPLYSIQGALEHDPVVVNPWESETFDKQGYTTQLLLDEVKRSDFAAFILTADDEIVSKGKEGSVPRDNVIFEMGLFMGKLGLERIFLVKPKGIEIKVPTDIVGIQIWEYDLKKDPNLINVANKIRTQIKKLGVF